MEIEKLTKKAAMNLVSYIEKIKSDNEMAHTEEDNLMAWFIKCVANDMYSKEEASEIAKVINETENISFARWHA